MLTFSLNSGSNGNAVYVEALGVRLLFDAGISAKQATARMRLRDREIRDVDAVLVSHDHSDHVRCAGVYQRRLGLEIYMSRPTYGASSHAIGALRKVRHFNPGETLTLGRVRVHTLKTPHDAADGAVFVVEAEGKRLGILTDLGHPFRGLGELIESLDAAYLESNYEPELLDTGRYPAFLKARVRGPGGHLSNHEAAELVARHGRRLQWLAVAHLSHDNNHPELAIEAQRRAAGRHLPVHHASRYGVSDIFEVR
ncbi:MAG: MBL fold metallo-hydrolase [Phycisphaerae bacterium]|nr:MBL fold metallo-hydrolase [Phycisphaerae bacterium]